MVQKMSSSTYQYAISLHVFFPFVLEIQLHLAFLIRLIRFFQFSDLSSEMSSLSLWLGGALIASTVVLASPSPPRITTSPDLARRQASVHIAAIVPTSPGQIGINPVSNELGNPDEYIFTDFGPNNPVVTWDGKTYKVCMWRIQFL